MGYGCGVISQERLKRRVELLLSANRKSFYMARRLPQQRMTLSDLEWPFHGLSVPSVWGVRADGNVLYTSSTITSISSASRAISAVAELLVIMRNDRHCANCQQTVK